LIQVGLNLTVPPVALVEERHVSRAADRVDLSRPARSRALQRLPGLFDDFLIRDSHGSRRSARADDIYDQLKMIIAHLERCWTRQNSIQTISERRVNIASSE
jgi:DNA-binding transcriptional LysR family regulator